MIWYQGKRLYQERTALQREKALKGSFYLSFHACETYAFTITLTFKVRYGECEAVKPFWDKHILIYGCESIVFGKALFCSL